GFLGKPTIKLTHRRTVQEVRSILRCRRSRHICPFSLLVDYTYHCIFLEEIVGSSTVRDHIAATRQSDCSKELGGWLRGWARSWPKCTTRTPQPGGRGIRAVPHRLRPDSVCKAAEELQTAASKKSSEVIKKLDEVRLRGRKRSMLG
uniref:non-specific serine/threonine protein kinase n=1 Tax=Cyclopterus lumpus TaxID=8103 RepID=A0A8C2YY66_CYCLU